MADDELQRAGFQTSSSAQWSPNAHVYPHSHHGTPAQEYSGFSFTPVQPIAESNAFAASSQLRPLAQVPPLVMPPWPSMLANQPNTGYHAMFVPSTQPIQPMAITPTTAPGSAISARSVSTPRKTLTDLDRKRMCQYHEEHPSSKQTEIGAIFGVERSTVSKVLRQKEKYLFQDDGSRSPIKRAKGRSPDIERALAVWAKNQERKGLPLTDDLIRDKARAFAATTTTPDNNVATNASWLEKFKLKNNLMGARSRKSSLAPDDSESLAASPPQAPGGISPASEMAHDTTSPLELHSVQSHDNLKNESPESSYFKRQVFHTQSTTSLSSAFTEQSAFSPGPLSPTTSPFFSPETNASSTFAPTPRPVLAPAQSTNSQRPRSQTFPLLDQYMIAATSSESLTPKYVSSDVLDSPMEEPSDPMLSVDGVIQNDAMQAVLKEDRPQTVTPAETMRPPPLPASITSRDRKRSITPATSTSSALTSTSHEEARNALQVVLSFFEQQPEGFLNFQESVALGKLMEKLKLPS